MKKEPLVSIYVPTHNRLILLKRAIISLIEQSYNNIEIIVCDDASSDGTEEYLNKLIEIDSRIKYLRNDTPQGACVSRNKAIMIANGEFITGIDDDDEFTSDRIYDFVSNWDDDFSFLCSNFINSYEDNTERKNYIQFDDKILNTNVLMYSNVASNQIFTKTVRLRKINGFDESVKRLQDWDTWYRLSLKYGKFKRLKKCTYIMHHENTNVRVSKSYSFDNALYDFIKRNKKTLSSHSIKYINFHIKRFNKKQRLSESFYWSILRLNPIYIFEFISIKRRRDE